MRDQRLRVRLAGMNPTKRIKKPQGMEGRQAAKAPEGAGRMAEAITGRDGLGVAVTSIAFLHRDFIFCEPGNLFGLVGPGRSRSKAP